MEATVIDHVNLRIPKAGIDDALAFYRDGLGFPIENLAAYREGDTPFFSVRLGEQSVIHVQPVDHIDPPDQTNFDHVAIVVDQPIDDVKDHLVRAGIDIEREGTPLGATGRNPAVYVRDPFGYELEIKSGV